nr:host range factor-1 [Calliteara abietis nucleopolyhedrovirus]
MGMSAEFFVDDEQVESYKCTGHWNGIVDARHCPALTVRYSYERGYGHYTLFIYFRHVATGMVKTKSVDVTDCDHVVPLPEEWEADENEDDDEDDKDCFHFHYDDNDDNNDDNDNNNDNDEDDDDEDEKERKHQVEVYVCMKGDNYVHDGPLFHTEPSRWFKNEPEHVKIRDAPLEALQQLNCASDAFRFVEAFIRIEEGEYVWNGDSQQPIEQLNIEKLIIIKNILASALWNTYEKVNSSPVLTFCSVFLEELTDAIQELNETY